MMNNNRNVMASQSNQKPKDVGAFPKFFVIETKVKNNKLSVMSPFVIEKVLQGSVGQTAGCKKRRQGGLLVKVTIAQADNLLKMTQFLNVELSVCAHRSLAAVNM